MGMVAEELFLRIDAMGLGEATITPTAHAIAYGVAAVLPEGLELIPG